MATQLEARTGTSTGSWTGTAAGLAAALFASHLPAGSRPDRAEVIAAVARSLRRHGGPDGCAVEVAGEYGDHPETAAARMRWALCVVAEVYR
jgi:hypothetical protein